ncbi:MAG: hypothetical protein N3G18_02360 [Candidatus Saccharicenans sp.]|nr:hypothetical protein [Candidatus Saccharicenans sp.]
MIPERISLARKIIRVFAFLSLVTFLVSLGLLILARLSLGSGGELRQLAGADFVEKFGLWVAIGSLLFGLAGLKTASGLGAARRWAWPASLVMAVVLVCLFPLGTIFGLKVLLDLFSREVKDWFKASGHWRATDLEAGSEYPGTEPDFIQQLEEQIKKKGK